MVLKEINGHEKFHLVLKEANDEWSWKNPAVLKEVNL